MPLVSIIIPAYGRPQHLRAAVASALQGGHDEIEVIVVDDGSPEPIADEIADLIESGTVRFHRQPNGGTAAGRNTGAGIARGEFLMFLDDDDMVVPGSIALRVRELLQRPDMSGVFGRFRKFADDRQGFEPDIELPVESVDRWTNMFACQLISPGQAIIRASDFHAVGGFATDCLGSDDWDLWMRLCTRKEMWRMSEFALSYRVHTGNFSNRLVAMSTGASRVAERARMLACPKHRATASYLVRTYVSTLYGTKLRAAATALAERGAWGAYATHSMMRLLLSARMLRAQVAFKLAIIAQTRRWSVPNAPEQLNGRGCEACRRLAVT